MPTGRRYTQMDEQRKDYIDPKRPPQRNCPKQLQTHNVPNYDVDNSNSIVKREEIYDSLTSCGLFSKEQKGCCNTSSTKAVRDGKI